MTDPASIRNVRRTLAALGLSLALTGVVLTATPAGASDTSIAKRLVITQADVGTTYSPGPGIGSVGTIQKVAVCVGTPVTGRRTTAHVNGPSLTNNRDASTITSSVDILKTKAMATRDRSVATNPMFAGCVAQVAKQQVSGLGSVTAQTVPFPSLGTFSTAIEAHGTLTLAGQPYTVTVTEIIIQRGRGEIFATFLAVGTQAFDTVQRDAILGKVATRLNTAKV